jgi:sulfate transport system ATP-binding protein
VTVELRCVRKTFGGATALDNVSLTVADGEFLALLGPSGSGKTTLLRALAGLEFVDSGDIVINGQSMRGVPARERGVGFVFQHYALFRHMTIARNVAFGLEVLPRGRRPSSRDIRSRVQSLLDLMEIGDLGGRYPEQISGGQRQRVALARALAIEPGLLLLDEPFGALDAKVRKSLRVWLRQLHDRMGLTSIFVTHDRPKRWRWRIASPCCGPGAWSRWTRRTRCTRNRPVRSCMSSWAIRSGWNALSPMGWFRSMACGVPRLPPIARRGRPSH